MRLGPTNSFYDEEAKKKIPHYKTIAQCQSRAVSSGILTCLTAMGLGYGAMIGLPINSTYYLIRFGKQNGLLIGIGVGVISSYINTKNKTKECQDRWHRLEEYSSYKLEREVMANTDANTVSEN